MTITVRFFAWLRDTVGCEACPMTLPGGSTASDARQAAAVHWPALAVLMIGVRPAINRAYGAWEDPLSDGDELALIPPVSGG